MLGKCLISFFIFLSVIMRLDSSEPTHRTKAAIEKQHDLWCYRCDTMVDGERCLDLGGNHTYMHVKCPKEHKKCQVKRISMSTSTDEITGKPKMWLVQRNCSETCEPGCIVIGERTKLHSCITCCDEKNFCNAGNGSKSIWWISNNKVSQWSNILLLNILPYVYYKSFDVS